MKASSPRPSARNKLMDYLARRDHSEKELRQKLKRNKAEFSPEEIEKAISFAKENKWIPNDELSLQRLSNQTADFLHRKKKGILFINAYLKEKGLPEVQSDDQLELEKAQELVKNKYSLSVGEDREKKQKLMSRMSRFLMSRGFGSPTIQKVIRQGWK